MALVLTGRLVQGDVYRMQPKKDNNNKTVLDAEGKPRLQYFVALAVAKGDPNWPAVRLEIDGYAMRFWPGGETRRADFAWKISDGDSTAVNKANKRLCDYDGFPGHHIVKFGTLYPPKINYWDTNVGKWVESPGGHVKIGDYVSVAFDVTSNTSTQTPGLHLNPKLIGLERAGDPIVGSDGPDANETFGARGPGAGPTSAVLAASPSGPAAGGPSSPTAARTDSYTGYMEGPDAPAPAPAHVMLPAAGNFTYWQYVAKGWTDQALRDKGYMQ